MKRPQWLDLCGNNAAAIFSLFFFFAKSSQSGLNGSISEDDRSAAISVTPQLVVMSFGHIQSQNNHNVHSCFMKIICLGY
jgi:hypothetical protein